jgi:site-specific DNA recombinase
METIDEAEAAGLGGRRGRSERPLRCFLYCRKSTEDDKRQVASIESQRMELQRVFGALPNLMVLDIYEEAQSAKSPGRPLFAEMLSRIERGEADCILSWAPDRLARNSVDGGHIIYLLDRGILRDLKFATYTFENNSQGKFMLSIMFGQSKYYSDALSDNVKRGNRTRVMKGWRLGSPPIGYLNDPTTKAITVDPVYFPLVRRMFDQVLTGGYSAKQVARIARDEWGTTSPKRRKGGGPITDSGVHRILTNPFYAGVFDWEGKVIRGAHEPLVSLEDFKLVQKVIRRPSEQRPKRHHFPFVGVIRCGGCGAGITAQFATNRYGVRYLYYRCTRKGSGPPCRQPYIRAEALEVQIADWLESIRPGSNEEANLRRNLDALRSRASASAHTIRESVETALRETQAHLTELLQLRLRRLVDDEDFAQQRSGLQAEAERLTRRLSELDRPEGRIEPIKAAAPLSILAADWFRTADDAVKRLIVKSTGSNLVLTNKILSVEAAKWLAWVLGLSLCPSGLGDCDEARTLAELSDDPIARHQLLMAAEVVWRIQGEGLRKAA